MAVFGLGQGLADMAMLPPQAARLFLLALAPVCLWVALSDLRAMIIPNRAVVATFALFVLLGPWVLPWGQFGWQLLAMPVFLALGMLANAMGLFGAGDAKFIAAAAPFVWATDARLMGMIFMANLLAAYLAHRLAKHSPLRALAPEWASWDAGAKFPMGRPWASSLMIYLAIASL